MKRIVPLFLILILTVCFCGCSAADKNSENVQSGVVPDAGSDIDGLTDVYVIGERVEGKLASGEGDSAVPGREGSGNGIQYASGILTCGEHSDLASLDEFRALFEKSEVWKTEAAAYKSYAYDSFKVNVTLADGAPAFNVPVYLAKGQDGETVCIARTDINGRAVLTVPGLYAGEKDQLVVRVGGVSKPFGDDLAFTVDSGSEVRSLDLMFMIDTTGSMSDELEYLKAEFRNVIRRICSAAPEGTAFSVRTSVNFYRDEGDEYVLRAFDFTDDVSRSLTELSAQYADGGGDFPEAVHVALESMVEHEWREDAVKLCFLVLDAPCHSDSEVQGVSTSINRSLQQAEAQGIRIIPIASSGITETAEMLFRSYAVQTNGTYIFLTDHSGVGGEHKDPTDIQDYEVELLNECMVRVVSEFCGLTYVKAPAPKQ